MSRSNLDSKPGIAGSRSSSGVRPAGSTDDNQWSIRATGGAAASRVAPSSSSGPSGQVWRCNSMSCVVPHVSCCSAQVLLLSANILCPSYQARLQLHIHLLVHPYFATINSICMFGIQMQLLFQRLRFVHGNTATLTQILAVIQARDNGLHLYILS